tara:strand:+ start:1507 stop:1803 length:297 start_codon:yes stop_codon:yes gene_type:complete
MKKNNTLSAIDWLAENKEKYPNGSVVSEIMDDYAEYCLKKTHEISPTQQDYEHVDLILTEAAAYGLRQEVEESAKKILKAAHINFVEAHHLAFEEWIK